MNAPQRMGAAAKGQVVLVLQGGGALGAYQGGVYEALREAGTRARLGDRHLDRRDQRRASSPATRREERLRAAARVLEARRAGCAVRQFQPLLRAASPLRRLSRGVPDSSGRAGTAVTRRSGSTRASYYSTAPLRETLTELVDPRVLRMKPGRA